MLAKQLFAIHTLVQSLFWHAVVMRGQDDLETVFEIALGNVEQLANERMAREVRARLRVSEWKPLLTRIRDGVRSGTWGDVQADTRRLMEVLRTHDAAGLGTDTRLIEVFRETESPGRRPGTPGSRHRTTKKPQRKR